MPGPIPTPIIRGLNSFVSVYSFSIQVNNSGTHYSIAATGNLIAAENWLLVGTPNPPECPDASTVTYAPFPTVPESFSCVLFVNTPHPGSAAIVLMGVASGVMRRRAGGAMRRCDPMSPSSVP